MGSTLLCLMSASSDVTMTYFTQFALAAQNDGEFMSVSCYVPHKVVRPTSCEISKELSPFLYGPIVRFRELAATWLESIRRDWASSDVFHYFIPASPVPQEQSPSQQPSSPSPQGQKCGLVPDQVFLKRGERKKLIFWSNQVSSQTMHSFGNGIHRHS